ncbi:hypothetical protein [Paludibacterium denitrificans]|nr:hypothetical protein [Paludibacterium denitrificans]
MHEALPSITVTPEKALSLVTYQACVSLIAESVRAAAVRALPKER